MFIRKLGLILKFVQEKTKKNEPYPFLILVNSTLQQCMQETSTTATYIVVIVV